jgi:TolB-like protein/DNA-binding winged helix-turn-helix (wHTH) protein/Tfp pilus assembly protein PilF
MSAPLDSVVCFGPFELDPRTGELRKAGVRINLPDQPFQVLKTLLERPGALVTRDELRQRLWSAETFVDFEHGLNAAVRRLRDALSDSADVPRFVETLPRRGYRFIAPVVRQPAAEATTTPPPPPADESNPDDAPMPIAMPVRRRTRSLAVGIGAVALVAAVALWTSGNRLWSSATNPSTSVSGRFMLAVLPFANMTGDADQEYIGDGMTEELIAQLGRMDPSRLGVIARTSAMQFKKTNKRANEIGADLGVSHMVEGSVRTTDGRIRIVVQLIDTRSQSQLWAEQYERDSKNLLTLQRDVAEAIARQITARLGIVRANATGEAGRHSTVAEAYEHYLRGRYHGRQDTTDDLHKAMQHFRRAIELDPSYALAYSGLADTYTLLGSYGVLPMGEAYPLGRAAARKALELDDTLGAAHNSLAAISADFYWEWAEAERHFKRAVELSPNDETALGFYASYLAYMGRHEEALTLATRAREMDPASPGAFHNLGVVHYFARRYDDAITQFRETLDLDPAFGGTHVMLGRVYVAQGLPDRALGALERAKALLGPRPDVIATTAYALARAGRAREALATLDELRRIAKPGDPAPFRIAYVHIGLGETGRAFEWLQKAIEARDWQMGMLKVEPAFDDLRSDPRFTELVERVGLPR